jgi:hypothetical protein
MFLATDNDTLELFRRAPDGTHSHLHTIVRHRNDIEDCDIAPDDSCTRVLLPILFVMRHSAPLKLVVHRLNQCHRVRVRATHRRGHSFSGRHGCLHRAQHLMTMRGGAATQVRKIKSEITPPWRARANWKEGKEA